MSAQVFRIRSEQNGTYYRGMSAIGPIFGATREAAAVFADGMDAYQVMKHFPMTVLADLVNDDDQPCTVDGRVLT